VCGVFFPDKEGLHSFGSKIEVQVDKEVALPWLIDEDIFMLQRDVARPIELVLLEGSGPPHKELLQALRKFLLVFLDGEEVLVASVDLFEVEGG